ncbi:E3 ubiquitin-protein ligase MARCHF2-like [Scylla paramamosain]|uniref:E3 ubiquitin-protein ligase MARCHF2-like n=1 Tax=Scylla paramamosain TaxID=85552 RepID=UPI003082F8CD
MESRNPKPILQDSPAPCISTSQETQDATPSPQNTPATCPIPIPTEPSPAPWDSRGALQGAQDGGGGTPTGASRLEEVQVTPPTSLTRSAKSRVSLVSMCRICHEGEANGALMRPCKCSGTMASVHRVCLERWLNLATSEKCELCGHRYNLRYTSRPFWEFLIKCDNDEARRALKVDLVCLLVLTPMAVLSVYLCSAGALQYLRENHVSFAIFTDDPNSLHASRSGRLEEKDSMGSEPIKAGWEAMVLLGVAVVLVLIYTCWASFTLKYHVKVWRQWRVVHQDVALDCTTPTPRHQSSAQDPESPPTPTTGPAYHAHQSHYPLNALRFLPEAAP